MSKPEFKTKQDIYKFIAEASISGNLGLFVGAGLPMAVLNNEDVNIALSWPKLLEACCKKLNVNFNTVYKQGSSFPQIASAVCKAYYESSDSEYVHAVSTLKHEILG